MKHLKRKFITLLTVACMLCTMSVPAFGAKNPDASKLSNPRTEGDTVTWDCVWFGHYPQSSNGKGGYNNDPIKWRVLSVNGDEALLLAEKTLDGIGFNEASGKNAWITSDARSWLNGYGSSANESKKNYASNNFIGKAFTSEEQAAIHEKAIQNLVTKGEKVVAGGDTSDKLFFLSQKEVTNEAYGFFNGDKKTDTRKAETTDYTKSKFEKWGVELLNMDKVIHQWWWLRTPGDTEYNVMEVMDKGDISPFQPFECSYHNGVRPALYLELNAACWSYAETVAKAKKPKEPKKPSVKKVVLKKAVSTKKGTLKLTWKRDKKATGYQAMVATDKKFKKNKKTATIKKNKTITKTFTKLKRKKTYYAKVRAYKQVGKTKVYGSYSKVKKAKVK